MSGAARSPRSTPRPGDATAKGSTVRSTLAFVELRYGAAVTSSALAAVAPELREQFASLQPTDEFAYARLVSLLQAIDALLAEQFPSWAEESGAHAIDSLGVQMYGGILRKATPRAFLTQSVSLFRLYYHPGDMEVVEDAAERAVLRLVGFDPVTQLFCRRQTGGLRRAIEIAGGGAARVRHVRCRIEGDAFCEWELHWQLEGVKPATS